MTTFVQQSSQPAPVTNLAQAPGNWDRTVRPSSPSRARYRGCYHHRANPHLTCAHIYAGTARSPTGAARAS